MARRMKCERCETDTHVETHFVDGYRGYLCSECQEEWQRLVGSSPAQ